MSASILNSLLQFDDQPEAYANFLNLLNDIFTFMFTGECMLKLFAFRKVSSSIFKLLHATFENEAAAMVNESFECIES